MTVVTPSRLTAESGQGPLERRTTHANWRRFAVAWSLALFMGLTAAALFGNLTARPEQPTPTGGVLVLTNAGAEPVTATVDAELWDMGIDGFTGMTLSIEFDRPKAGLHWYVIPSGQYEIPASAPDTAYCLRRAERETSDRLVCPTEGTTYRPGGLGSVDGLSVSQIVDSFDGYDDATASVLEGVLARDPETGEVSNSVEILIPIRTPPRREFGSDTYGDLAPVAAVNLGDYGTAGTVRSLAPEVDDNASFYAETATGDPLRFVNVSAVRVSYRQDEPVRSIAFASPPTSRSDALEWNNPAVRTQPIRYVLHDPIRETDLARRAFLAGILASAAVGLVFLPMAGWFEGTSRISTRRDTQKVAIGKPQ